MRAAERWKSDLAGWAVPDEILSAAPESPWGFPAKLFADRTRSALNRDPSPANLRALDALPEAGSVLDVGVGGGAGSLPLAGRAGLITGVDPSPDMLESFTRAAGEKCVASATVLGSWPDVAAEVDPADVVVCHHVLYNVAELEPFVTALSAKARHRVVIEITPTHPLAWMSDLWMRFHRLERPQGPTYSDAEEVAKDLGFRIHSELSFLPPVVSGYTSRQDAIALVRKRLCLHPDQDEELAEALGDRLAQRDGLWSASPPQHEMATLWWSPA